MSEERTEAVPATWAERLRAELVAAAEREAASARRCREHARPL